MKSMLMKEFKEKFRVRKIQGKCLSSYSFYQLLGFMTRMEKGEVIK